VDEGERVDEPEMAHIEEILAALSKATEGDFSANVDETVGTETIASLSRSTNALIEKLHGQAEELREVRAQLEESERTHRRLEAILPGMVYDLSLRLDGSYVFLYVNDASRELFGLSPDELRRDWTLLYARERSREVRCLDEAIRGKTEPLARAAALHRRW